MTAKSEERSEVRDARKPGWFWMHNAILDQYGARLGANGIAIYSVLVRRANKDGECWPSIKGIADLTGIKSRTTIKKYLKTLQQLKLIKITRRSTTAGNQDSNLYHILEPAVGRSADDRGVGQQMTGGRSADDRGVGQQMNGGRSADDHEGLPNEGLPNKGTSPPSPTLSSGGGDLDASKNCARAKEENTAGERTPPSRHKPKSEAVEAFRDIVHRYPNAAQQEAINQAVSDLDRWKKAVQEWQLRGYNPTNVKGMLEWYNDGIPSTNYGSKNENWRTTGQERDTQSRPPPGIERPEETPEFLERRRRIMQLRNPDWKPD